MSFSKLFEFWDVLSKYVNPLSALLWGLIGGLAALILVVILQIVLRKKILVTRKYRFLKVLSYCYMVFFPLWAGMQAAQWFALHNLQSQITNNIPLYLGKTNELFNGFLKDEVTKVISERHMELTGHKVIEKSATYVSNTASNLFGSTLPSKDEAGDKFVVAALMQSLVKSGVIKKYVVKYIESSIGSALLMDKKLTKEFMDTTFKEMVDKGMLNTILTKHVNHLFRGFKSNILLTFLLVMCIPVIEIIIACRREKKMETQPAME